MANLDSGAYFLTVLAPIDNSGIIEHDGVKSSPVHMTRDALSALPTAMQSPQAEATGLNSFFARNRRTHLARFVVLDDVFYNGREAVDTIVDAIRGTDLVEAQPIDSLPKPYLLFVADFDPDPGGASEPRNYLEGLWDVAAKELSAVFAYCDGFQTVKDRGAFASFIIARQVETTLPFHDYWITPPPLPTLATWKLLAPLGVAALLAFVGTLHFHLAWPGAVVLLVALLAVAVWADYALVMSAGGKAFPPAPGTTLPHVLKALYLQQAFIPFAGRMQGEEPGALKAAFMAFAREQRLDDLDGPTQAPGVVKSRVGADI
jgi:hypothetical protein